MCVSVCARAVICVLLCRWVFVVPGRARRLQTLRRKTRREEGCECPPSPSKKGRNVDHRRGEMLPTSSLLCDYKGGYHIVLLSVVVSMDKVFGDCLVFSTSINF